MPRCSAGLLCLLVLAAALPARAVAGGKPLVLASGSEKGVYFPVAQGIARVAGKEGLSIVVVRSEGSRENLSRISAGQVDLGLAQSDSVFDAFHGLNAFPVPITNVRAIAALYTEQVQILVRHPLYIQRIQDFRGKRIAIGPPGSGTETNARAVLAASGITLAEVNVQRLDLQAAAVALQRGDVDIAFVTSGVPSAVVAGVLRQRIASLYELPPEVRERLVEDRPSFLVTSIPGGSYPHQLEKIATVGVKAVLVGRSDLPPTIVYRLIAAVMSRSGEITTSQRTELEPSTEGVPIPLFPAASRYIASRGGWRAEVANRFSDWAPPTIAALLILCALAVRRHITRRLRKYASIRKLAVFLISMWLAGSLALHFAERRLNENYATVWRSLWSGVITIFSLSNKEPVTVQGRFIAVAMLMLGYGGIVSATGIIAALYMHSHFSGGLIRMRTMSQHYVIVNWNDKGPGIIQQLHGEDLHDEGRPIIVVSDKVHGVQFPGTGSVYKQEGSGTDEQVLRRARVEEAHSVIVLAEGGSEGDAKAIITILAIRKICNDPNRDGAARKRQVPIIVEILDPQKVPLAKYAGSGEDESVEVVSSHELGQGLLTQAAVHPGLTSIYRKLLTFEKGNSEIHESPIPETANNSTFADLTALAAQLRRDGLQVVPIAVGRERKVFINPRDADLGLLRDGDTLFALCDNSEELELFWRRQSKSSQLAPAKDA